MAAEVLDSSQNKISGRNEPPMWTIIIFAEKINLCVIMQTNSSELLSKITCLKI